MKTTELECSSDKEVKAIMAKLQEDGIGATVRERTIVVYQKDKAAVDKAREELRKELASGENEKRNRSD